MKKVRFNLSKVVAIATCLAVTTMFSGCDDKKDKNDEPTNITVENRDALTQTVYADEKPLTVSFATKGAWTSSISEGTSKSTVSWISITPDSGDEAGAYTVTISLAPNDTDSDRTATITISCDGTTITVSVTQKATKRDGTPYDPDITVTNGAALAQTVYAAETPEALSIVTKGAWTSTKTAAWVSLSPSQGSAGSHTIAFSLVPNDTGADRAAEITITCGETSITVNITQKSTNRDGTQYEPDPNAPKKGDVYVAGYVTEKSSWIATVWKNGVAQYFTGTRDARAFSIFVSGNDVYVAGHDVTVAKLWKNGVTQDLTGAEANSVFVSGNDVYVAGYRNINQMPYISSVPYAAFWKNGIMQDLEEVVEEYPPTRVRHSCARSVFVSGSDVYVAGEVTCAKLWKNGKAQDLTWRNYRTTVAYSVFVSGSDVYVAGIRDGYLESDATLWINGEEQFLTNYNSRPNIAIARSVFVSGSDVYVCGVDRGVAKLWKNGVAQDLTIDETTISSDAHSVFVSGDDVYVVGNDGIRAVLWKNGEPQYLSDGTNSARAFSVFVVDLKSAPNSCLKKAKHCQ